MAVDRGLIRLLLVLLAIVLAVLWTVAVFPVPHWMLGAAVISLAVACLL